MDAFNLLYSKLSIIRLCLFVFGATAFAESRFQFIRICSYLLSVRGRQDSYLLSARGREAPILEVAVSKAIRSKVK